MSLSVATMITTFAPSLRRRNYRYSQFFFFFFCFTSFSAGRLVAVAVVAARFLLMIRSFVRLFVVLSFRLTSLFFRPCRPLLTSAPAGRLATVQSAAGGR